MNDSLNEGVCRLLVAYLFIHDKPKDKLAKQNIRPTYSLIANETTSL